ncbi:uncharacterized protein LOC144167122 [Haemaphysalis longicornis]
MIIFEKIACFVLPWLLFCVRRPPVTPKPANGPIDAFKAIGNLPELVIAYTTSSCPNYHCVNATRTRYVEATKEATYVWSFDPSSGLKNSRKKAVFNIKFENEPDKAPYVLDGDVCHDYQAYYPYSDYETCLVAVVPYYLDTLCILFVERTMLTNVPKPCMDAFYSACDTDNSTVQSC